MKFKSGDTVKFLSNSLFLKKDSLLIIDKILKHKEKNFYYSKCISLYDNKYHNLLLEDLELIQRNK